MTNSLFYVCIVSVASSILYFAYSRKSSLCHLGVKLYESFHNLGSEIDESATHTYADIGSADYVTYRYFDKDSRQILQQVSEGFAPYVTKNGSHLFINLDTGIIEGNRPNLSRSRLPFNHSDDDTLFIACRYDTERNMMYRNASILKEGEIFRHIAKLRRLDSLLVWVRI